MKTRHSGDESISIGQRYDNKYRSMKTKRGLDKFRQKSGNKLVGAREFIDDGGNDDEETDARRDDSLRSIPPFCVGMIVCLLLFFLVIFITSIASFMWTFDVNRRLDVYSYTLEFEGDQAVYDGIPGDLDARGGGKIRFDSHTRRVDWNFYIKDLDDVVTKIDLMGPIEVSDPLVTTSVYKELLTTNTNNINFEDSAELSRTKAVTLAKNPWKYYILVRTELHPTGAVRAPLGHYFFVNEKP